MILYHFTSEDCLASIRERGLVPAVDDSGMTADKAVVWLTEDDHTRLSAADRAKLGDRCVDENSWLVGCPERFLVRLGSHDPNLKHYLTWLGRRRSWWPGKPEDANMYEAAARWWIYLGRIGRERIERA